jgi:hypothetical protein
MPIEPVSNCKVYFRALGLAASPGKELPAKVLVIAKVAEFFMKVLRVWVVMGLGFF